MTASEIVNALKSAVPVMVDGTYEAKDKETGETKSFTFADDDRRVIAVPVGILRAIKNYQECPCVQIDKSST